MVLIIIYYSHTILSFFTTLSFFSNCKKTKLYIHMQSKVAGHVFTGNKPANWGLLFSLVLAAAFWVLFSVLLASLLWFIPWNTLKNVIEYQTRQTWLKKARQNDLRWVEDFHSHAISHAAFLCPESLPGKETQYPRTTCISRWLTRTRSWLLTLNKGVFPLSRKCYDKLHTWIWLAFHALIRLLEEFLQFDWLRADVF